MDGEEMFKAILKAYTGESLNDAFKKKLIAGKYDEIRSFLTAYIRCVNNWGFSYAY